MRNKKLILGVTVVVILVLAVLVAVFWDKDDTETNQNGVVTPTASVVIDPTSVPTEQPTEAPTVEPTKAPTKALTATLTETPKVTEEPTPTEEPVATPTPVPTKAPTATPTPKPTATPTPKPTATPTPKPTEVPMETITETLGKANVGEYVTFGRYEQDNDKANGAEEIEWLVLDKQDGKMLLLSKHIIENKVFHEQWGIAVTWDMCDLRTWLNNDFYKTAFNSTEQSLIETTHVITLASEKAIGYGIKSSEDTYDKVFVLSVDEALTYFDPNYKTEDPLRMSQPTKYAEAMGVRVYAREKYPELKGNGWWWLRTPGDASSANYFTAYVNMAGIVDLGGTHANYADYAGVRPAVWVTIE